jgi:hypothetical protein
MSELRAFQTWREVLVHVQAGKPVWYQAPMDYRPIPVRAQIRGRAHSVVLRVYPPISQDADPFTADARHLDRFRYQATEVQA